ncbi:NAC transcription factor NAM-2 [Lolium perenne]|uniref:NAC transcription factor NAM-2 n=1 Tax=Lolium perenne TaxID=4522 RepID=UPI0021EACE43|nr:NAC transcription factor NAM-2-like [Lolium perenne]
MAQPADVRSEGATGGGVACRVPAGPAGHGGLPIGFRFRPTDEELVLHYLRRKAFACPLPADIIPVVDLARIHPSDLPGDADGERFFFHLPATRCWRKGGGGGRAGGAGGVWRASGKEALVLAPRCGRPVGAKRTLVFCARGGARTAWAMHEYRLLPAALGAWAAAAAAKPKDWVVCRVFKKATPARRGAAQRRRNDAHMAAPSPASSCVTEARGEEEVEGDEEIASF